MAAQAAPGEILTPNTVPEATRAAAVGQFQDWLRGVSSEEGLQLIPLAGIAKSDVAFMAVHPEPRRLQRLGQEIVATSLGTCLAPIYSFLSISEVSEYMSSPGDWARRLIDDQKMDPASPEFLSSMKSFSKRMAAYADARVHPQLPDTFPMICFYPMSKARDETRNWYTLDFADRKRYMGGHASTGRRFADRVTQLITSSIGLDDWEWGVTLSARDLKSLRDVVYEMRFDLGSAIYAQFGPFYVGVRFQPDEMPDALRL
jgi:chlorite dismutase